MSIPDNPCVVDINSCSYIFLDEITESPGNRLRVVLHEGLVSPEARSLKIGNTVLSGLHAIRTSEKSRKFEVSWEYYVAYSVINESFAAREVEAVWIGHLFRVYSKSCFKNFIAAATFATEEYPGPMEHIGLICENHIIDVISTKEPSLTRLT